MRAGRATSCSAVRALLIGLALAGCIVSSGCLAAAAGAGAGAGYVAAHEHDKHEGE